jgi:hypothetical protein
MKVLVATALTQGERPGDDNWCIEGELVWVQEPCASDRRDPDGPCGCGRGFAGMSSHRPTTTCRVAEIPEFSREDMIMALQASLRLEGWPTEWAVELADGMLELASLWPEGAVIDRRIDDFGPRVAPA